MVPTLLVILCLALAAWFIANELAGNMGKATVLKGLASLMFVCLGAWCLSQNDTPFGKLILVGLVLGMVGDVFLNMRNLYTGAASNKVFAVGILAFLSGHFLYIAALIRQGASLLPAIIAAAVLSAAAIPPLMRQITAPSKGLKIFGYVYLVVIIAMFSLSAVLLAMAGATLLHLIFSAGALLFVVSDFILIYNSFGKKRNSLRVANLSCYYAAQILIAFCIYLAT